MKYNVSFIDFNLTNPLEIEGSTYGYMVGYRDNLKSNSETTLTNYINGYISGLGTGIDDAETTKSFHTQAGMLENNSTQYQYGYQHGYQEGYYSASVLYIQG